MKITSRIIFVIAIIIMTGATIGQTTENRRFVVNHSNGTVLDTKTNLMWASKDNSSDISWTDAKVYCESYTAGGYTDWRMPTHDELASLYDANKTRPAPCFGSFKIHVATKSIDITCFAPWTSETRGSDASQLNFVNGTRFWYLQSQTYGTRALPVRSNK